MNIDLQPLIPPSCRHDYNCNYKLFHMYFFFSFLYIKLVVVVVREGEENVGKDIIFIARLAVAIPSCFCFLISSNFGYN